MSICEQLGDGGPVVICDGCARSIPLKLASRVGGVVTIACPDCGERSFLAGAEGMAPPASKA